MTDLTNNKESLRINFHSFTLGDVDDIEIHASQPIYEWQQTPQGKWVMQHAQDLAWQHQLDPNVWGYRVTVYGYLQPQLATEYVLRYSGLSR